MTGCSVSNRNLGNSINLADKYNQANEIKDKYQLEGLTLIKKEIKNAELDKYKGEPKDEIKIEIGDKATGLLGANTDFEPSITLTRWNEVNFKIKPKSLDKVASKDKTLSFEGNKIKFGTPKISFEMFDVPATAQDEGGYKYIWYLNEKPASNIISFDIETSGLDFFYQPALNEEMKNENCWTSACTETDCCDSHRPENVVGSYAVYHQTKGGMNNKDGKEYKTGKAFHIYRPHIIDAEGKETWGNLHIENGIYSVEIPQDFLDKAVYPIKSNDTVGYGSVGASSSNSTNGSYIGRRYAAASGGNVVSMSFYGRQTGSGKLVKTGIYDIQASSVLLVELHATALPGSAGWLTLDSFYTGSGYTIVNATTYNIGYVIQDATCYTYYDTSGIGEYYYSLSLISDAVRFTDPKAMSYYNDAWKNSIYATYTPSAEETSSSRFIKFNSGTIFNDKVNFNN